MTALPTVAQNAPYTWNVECDSSGIYIASRHVTLDNTTTLGQQLAAASYPVVPASDYIFPVKGTYTEVIGNGPSTVNGANTDLFAWTDVSAYKWLSLQISGTYSGTLTFQMSNDQSLVLTQQLTLATAFTGPNVSGTTASTSQIWAGPVLSRYFRVRMTSFASNASLAGVLELYAQPPFIFPASLNCIPVASTATIGATPLHLVSLATNNATSLKNASGNIYSLHAYNTTASVKYVKFYNKATAPAPASDTPAYVLPVPGNGYASDNTTVGITFSTGIGYAVVAGSADNDNTAVAVGDIILDGAYK